MKQTGLQDQMLNGLRKSGQGMTIFLTNGFQLRGKLAAFDSFVLVVLTEEKQQMVYKHAISTIVPMKSVALE